VPEIRDAAAISAFFLSNGVHGHLMLYITVFISEIEKGGEQNMERKNIRWDDTG
jgi:hypothetical protein